MATLFDKVQTLVSANLHAMVDMALKANSLAVFDEYIRQAEDNLTNLEDAAATVGGNAKTLERKADDYRAQARRFDEEVNALLKAGKETLAAAVQHKFTSADRTATNYEEQYARTQAEYQKLLDNKLKLEAKLATIKSQREEMQSLLELAKAKEKTVGAIRSLKDLDGTGDADIQRITDSIRSRLDQADVRAQTQMDTLEKQVDDALGMERTQRQLEERKKKLGLTS